MTSASASLGKTTIVLHWAVAIGLIGLLSFGTYISWLESGPEKTSLIQLHKSFGVIIGSLALVRLIWRARERFPAPIGRVAAWERRIASSVQTALLAISVMMPLAGIMTSLTYARDVKVFGIAVIPKLMDQKDESLNEFFSASHAVMATLLLLLLALHIAGALRHHFIQRDGTLLRMLGSQKPPS